MTSLTLESRQKHRRLPQVDVPIVEDNDELRRFGESIKEHLRMYEGDSGAPKERFVTIEELEHVGLVTTKIQQGFASIDKLFGQQIAAVPSANPTTGAPGGGGGGGGVRTLKALDDTRVDGIAGGQGIVWNGSFFVPTEIPNFKLADATRYDMLFFNGEEWIHTDQELQWNPTDDYLQLANEHSINWLDTVGATQELVNFTSAAAAGASVGHIIKHLDAGVSTTSGTYVDVSGAVVTYAEMEANTDYVVYVRAYMGADGGNTALNGCQLTKGGSLVSGSETLYEPPWGLTIDSNGMMYYWGGVIDSGASGDLQLQIKSGNAGVDTAFANNVSIMMIKVDDLGLGTNVFHDTNTSVIELDADYAGTGAQITIGDGVSDYLVFGSVRVDNFYPASNIIDVQINDGSTQLYGMGHSRADSSDELTLGFMQLWQAPAASTTLNVEAKTSFWSADKVYACIIAIRLDAFVGYQVDFLAQSDPFSGGGGDTDVTTLAFAVGVTDDYCLMACGTGTSGGASDSPDPIIRNDLNGTGDATLAGEIGQDWEINIVAGHQEMPHWVVSSDQSWTAADAVDADFNVTHGTSGSAVWLNNFLIAFSWSIGGSDVDLFDVGNTAYTTRLLGLTNQINNDRPITWLDSDSVAIELAILGASVQTDEFFDDVVNVSTLDNSSQDATEFTSELGGHNFTATVAAGGVAKITSAESKFGTYSIFCDDEAGAMSARWGTTSNSTSFDFAALDWTMECWLLFERKSATDIDIFAKWIWIDRTFHWTFDSTAETFVFTWSTNGTNTGGGASIAWPVDTYVTGQWYHMAAVRDGNTLKFFVDGVQCATTEDVTGVTFFTADQEFEIFSKESNGSGDHATYMSNARITKGTARYTTGFTPPTAAPPIASSPGEFTLGDPLVTMNLDASEVRFRGATAANYLEIENDDTDINIAGVNLTDINITGITAINAGTVDVDFDDITATTYGGILEANLVDKSVQEVIQTYWTWSSTQPKIRFNQTDGAANNRLWELGADNEQFTLTVWNDAQTQLIDVFNVERTLNVVDSFDFLTNISAVSYEGILATDLVSLREMDIGVALDSPDVSVSAAGGVITFTLEDTGGGDIRFYFSDGVHTHDCTDPIASVTLTAGTDTSPTLNYVYILQSDKALTKSTAGWPAAEHAPLATVLCQSAASLQTDGAYKMHAWTDHTWDDAVGHIGHLNHWIREQPATWVSGTLCTTSVGAATFDIAVASGQLLQLHDHAFPAFNTATGSEIMIVNQNGTAYDRVGNMVSQITDAAGVTMSGKYYNLVVWAVVSEDDADCQLMVNLPTASYNTSSSAVLDSLATTVYDMPTAFIGTGFLVARLVCRHQVAGNTYTIVSNIDLRGTKPSTSAGGTVGGGVTSFGDLSDCDDTGASQDDLLVYDGSGNWVDTAGLLTWSGTNLFVDGTSEHNSVASFYASGVRAAAAISIVAADHAAIYFQAVGAAAEEENWGVEALDTGVFRITSASDADGAGSTFFEATRSAGSTAIADLALSAATLSLTGATTISGALIATSYGGITEANLVDKTADEGITGQWSNTLGWNANYTSEGSAFGATIFGMGLAFNGGISGVDSSLTGLYGLKWIRATHANAKAEIAEGMYVAVNAVIQGGIGTAGIWSTGDVSGTTIGGITEANLVDKSAVETIAGEWHFSVPVQIQGEITTSPGTLGVEFGGRISSGTALDNRVQAYIGVHNTGGPFSASAGDLVICPRTSIAGKILFATGSLSPSERMRITDAGIAVTGEVSGTTIGGITQANLVDKTASETISGQWDFTHTDGLSITSSGPKLIQVETSVTADNTTWRLMHNGEQLNFSFMNDAQSAATDFFTFTRTLNVCDVATLTAASFVVSGTAKAGGNFLLEGYATGRNILRTMVWNITPGATPGTNVNTVDLSSSRGFNPIAASNATNLAKSASSGDWDLDVSGALLAFSPSESIVGIISCSVVLHDLNSSSTTEMYFVDADVAAGHINFRIAKRGTTANLDWTTLLDAGDVVRVVCSMVTST